MCVFCCCKIKIKISYKSNIILRKRFSFNNNLYKINGNKTGVNKLSYSDCNKFYIGKTGESFTTRYKPSVTHSSTYIISTHTYKLIYKYYSKHLMVQGFNSSKFTDITKHIRMSFE